MPCLTRLIACVNSLFGRQKSPKFSQEFQARPKKLNQTSMYSDQVLGMCDSVCCSRFLHYCIFRDEESDVGTVSALAANSAAVKKRLDRRRSLEQEVVTDTDNESDVLKRHMRLHSPDRVCSAVHPWRASGVTSDSGLVGWLHCILDTEIFFSSSSFPVQMLDLNRRGSLKQSAPPQIVRKNSWDIDDSDASPDASPERPGPAEVCWQ